MRRLAASVLSFSVILGGVMCAEGQQPPPPRTHRVTSKGELNPLPASVTPNVSNQVTIEVVGDERIIRSNGIPNHKTGRFPNSGNPNRISVQEHEYRIPANPQVADSVTPMRGEFGVAVNGIPFDPGAGEFYAGEPGWQYEPLSGAIELGIDVSHAHVQPTGKYHYHGLPAGLLDSVNWKSDRHSPLIGWAADGFPIYAMYGYADPGNAEAKIKTLKSSYRLKSGMRPGGSAPGGRYDGTFVRDYEYVEGSGDLDECNGMFTVTPEYPDGTYAYFMTEDWPVVPRNFRGTPSDDFSHGPGGGGPGGGFGPMAGRRGRSGSGNAPQNPGQRGGQGGPGMHGGGRPGPPQPGQILPLFVRESLNLTAQQTKELDALQKTVDDRLAEILTERQKRQLQNAGPPGGPGQAGFGGPPGGPGQGGFGGPPGQGGFGGPPNGGRRGGSGRRPE